MRKALSRETCTCLEAIPNVGPAMAEDLRLIGIHSPAELQTRDPWQLYLTVCQARGERQDPCVLDTLMAAVDFMNGADPRSWWSYTQMRKTLHPKL